MAEVKPFEWVHPQELTPEEIDRMGLVYGVAAVEGDAKGHPAEMGSTGIIMGAGGLRLLAQRGEAVIDIDHNREKLPAEYSEKYGAGINDPYPVGHILDVQPVKNDNDKIELQYVAAIHNRTVYDLIKDGKIKGNSVTDESRGTKCDKTCEYTGNAYSRNSLMLEAVPSMHGTWVSAITAENVKDVFSISENRNGNGSTHWLETITKEKEKTFAIPEAYHDGEKWLENGVFEYLTKEKELDETRAKEIVAFYDKNPDALSNFQWENMSNADYIAWHDHSPAMRIYRLEKEFAVFKEEKETAVKELNEVEHKLKEDTENVELKAPESVDSETKEPDTKIEYDNSIPAENDKENDPHARFIIGQIYGLVSTFNSIVIPPYSNGRFAVSLKETIFSAAQSLAYTVQNDFGISLNLVKKDGGKLSIVHVR